MPQYSDVLGDEMKRLESQESGRCARIGEPVLVRVDGVGFSKFTRSFDRPFDTRIARAMDAACVAVIDRLHPVIGYTQSDEISFIFWDPEFDLPYGGRFYKLATICASLAGAAFLRAGLELFPERLERHTPIFDGRAWSVPRPEAAKELAWREIDARRNAVTMAAHAVFGPDPLHGKSSAEMKEMLLAEGIDLKSCPERYLRGAFFRREKVAVERSDEELARIPSPFRMVAAASRIRTMTVGLEGVPPLSVIDNLESFIFGEEDPLTSNRNIVSIPAA